MAKHTVPRFFALKSVHNNKYLRYLNEEGEANKYIQFSGEEVLSPYVKYEAEKATSGNGLVHLRCCYNNKYWARVSESSLYIAATSDEPEEDRSKWSCTLFEPLFIDAKTLRFRHALNGNYACLWRASPPFADCISASTANTDKDKCDVYTIIDWESLWTFPKHIALKGDNGAYVSATTIKGSPHLQFAGSNIEDQSVGLEVFTTDDGNIRIKSNLFNKFWRRSPNWIVGDSDDTTAKNPETVYLPIKLGNDVVAFRSMGNNNFCKRLTADGLTSCMAAKLATIDAYARMKVEELVLSRKIYYVDFRLMDARIYSKKLITMANGSAENNTQDSKTVEVKLTYTETKSSTWNSSVSLKLGTNSATESEIPVIGDDGKVKLSDEFTGVYQWGKTESSENIVSTVYQVALPPMSVVKVSLVATKGSCDVPFSYTQRDILNNGENIAYDMDDGVFSGTNYFDFKFETKQE